LSISATSCAALVNTGELFGKLQPHLERPVISAAGDALAVGAEGHAEYTTGVRLEGEGLLAGGEVPEEHRAGQPWKPGRFAAGCSVVVSWVRVHDRATR